MKILRELLRNKNALFGLLLLIGFTTVAFLAPILAPPRWPSEPYRIPRAGFSMEPRPPTAAHPFGTTQGQYDIYYGVIWGTRTAFKVGLIVTGATLCLGVLVGSLAAYFGGIVDEVVMRIVDIFMAVPFILAALVLTSILGRGLDKAMIAMICFGWMGYARMIRGDILAVKEKEFVSAAIAMGSSWVRVLLRHVLPNAIYPVLIQASMQIGSMVIWASTLSFLGVGAPEGYADWGQLISFSRNWITGDFANPLKYWYTIVFPGGAIVLFVLSWNLIGDALRDILDPRLRGVR